ncbi:polyprenol monophosphomannose synthase [Sanguibacter antarcticus]|uniref:Dolichol-phosphate mannosyltransferase n=1 Tax=Sanguibacter antarcticus TaxID=372484 RepID=A0A2A9E2G6_9MICO|nr:polyprenol monophosphomannose synthase [Sanguibacter antarcticus]PFG33148.1 dolichol-phosphate mannosyltransferase [Sanguibacter antarcticus]
MTDAHENLTDAPHAQVHPQRVLVIVPTYDERANLPTIVAGVRHHAPDADVLVVDDASPDGTGDVADALSADDPQVFVMHRTGKQGLGTAYIAAFAWGLERGYATLVEMDADGSHRPQDLPELLAPLAGGAPPALVLGSRWVPGGAVVNWPRHREWLSRGGNTYVRLALGLHLGDATGGFRAFQASTLRTIDLGSVESQGYCFQVDMAWRVAQAGGRIVEVPITFVERTAGESKMSRGIVKEALWKVTTWGVARRARQVRQMFGGRSARTTQPLPSGEEQGL